MRGILPHPAPHPASRPHRTTLMRNRLMYAGFGVLATLFGMATGHLVAAFVNPDASPVLAVGSAVIDLTPQPLKEWAIQHFGSNDKTVLVGSVLVGALLLAAVRSEERRVGKECRCREWP